MDELGQGEQESRRGEWWLRLSIGLEHMKKVEEALQVWEEV